MSILDNSNREEKEKYFKEKYKGKIRFAGHKHNSIKLILSLINNTKPNPKNFFVAEGLWALEKVKKYNNEIEAFLICPEIIYTQEAINIADYFINKANNSYIVSKKVFDKISEREGPDGLIAVSSLKAFSLNDIELKGNNILVILDGIEIPGNIGTIIRTTDGAGADAVLICNRRARLTHPKVIRGSHGALLKIPLVETEIEELISWLSKNNFKIYLTDTDAKMEYYEPDYKGRIAIISGSERYGISKEWYKTNSNIISIPMYGDSDSLNVAISTAIVLYQVSLSQKGKLK